VYRRDCPNAPTEQTAIPLAWLGDRRTGTPVRVNVQAVDRARLLGQVLQEVYDLYDQGLYLLHVEADVQRDRSAKVQMHVDAADYRSVDLLSHRLDRLRAEGVIDVAQINVLDPLEKMLLADRGSPSNPYMPGQPVDDPRTFKGREAELNKIVTWLRGDQNAVVLSGTNRVGKTSLLRYLHHHVAPQYGFLPVLVDLQGLSRHNETAFWLDAAQEIDAAIARHYGSAQPRGLGKTRRRIEQYGYDGFCERLESVKPALRDQKLLIMIDELNAVDELWDRHQALSFVSHLKSLIQNKHEVAFVLCVQETVYREALCFGRELLSSPLVQMGPPLRLDYLDPYAAQKLIREPMIQMLRYDDGTVERIVRMTAGHPYYLQTLLHRIVGTVAPSDKSASISITADHVDAIVPELLADGNYLFNDLLREPQGGRSRAILGALAHAKRDAESGATMQEIQNTLDQHNISIPVSQLSRLLEYMCSVGTIQSSEGDQEAEYDVRVPLFSRWLVENQPLG
jgi:hypothetical protein